MGSFAKLATVTASTKRSPGITDGLEGEYTENITSLACLPLDPVNPEVAQGFEGLSFRELLQTSVDGGIDIVEGDILVVDTIEYPIRAVADWTWRGSDFRRLFLEGRLPGLPVYSAKVLGTNPIAYWPLWEADTSAAVCQVDPAQNGVYTGVTLGEEGIGDGRTCPLFDGVNDYVNIFTTTFRDAFDEDEGSMMVWAKVADAGVWTDGVSRRALTVGVDGNNRVLLQKSVVANAFEYLYTAGGVSKLRASTISSVDWNVFAITWSKSADEVRAYLAGTQQGTTLNGLGVWVGNLSANTTVIGAGSTVPAAVFHGYLAHVAIWDRPLTLTEIEDLAVLT